MKRLKITNFHGFTLSDLRSYEKQEVQGNIRNRIMAVRRFNEGGMDLLLERKFGKGRSCLLTEEQQRELKETILNSSPSDHGLGTAVSWTTPIISAYIQSTYDVQMTLIGVLRKLWRLSLSYTRPTYVLKKADIHKQRLFSHQLDWIKKRLERKCSASISRWDTHSSLSESSRHLI